MAAPGQVRVLLRSSKALETFPKLLPVCTIPSSTRLSYCSWLQEYYWVAAFQPVLNIMCLLQRLVEEIESKEPEKNAVVRLSRNVQSTLNVWLGFPM